MASNPVFNKNAFERAQQDMNSADQVMTLQGTINKTFFLLFLCVVGGMLSWTNYTMGFSVLIAITIVTFIIGIITAFKPKISPITAPIYSFLEGLFLGAVSAEYNASFPGIVFNAVAITLLIFFFMLFIYRTRIIKVTKGFNVALISAMMAIFVLYLVSSILYFFGVNTAYLTSSSPLSIGISVVVCIVAAFNFLSDFNFIDKMTGSFAAPKFMEWYAGFGLIVTLIWLYYDILRLLGKILNRR